MFYIPEVKSLLDCVKVYKMSHKTRFTKVLEKLKELSWYGHIMSRDENYLTKGILNWKIDGYKNK